MTILYSILWALGGGLLGYFLSTFVVKRKEQKLSIAFAVFIAVIISEFQDVICSSIGIESSGINAFLIALVTIFIGLLIISLIFRLFKRRKQ